MSAIKTWQADLGTAQCYNTKTEKDLGAGDCKRIYVGRTVDTGDNIDAHGYLRFNLDWTDVGRIINARLTLYADDGEGILGGTIDTDEGDPQVIIDRLTSKFSEATGKETFDIKDVSKPTFTTTGRKKVSAPTAPFEPLQVDITDFVEAWAPKRVKKRTGDKCDGLGNFGIRIAGVNKKEVNHWAFFSEDEPTLTAYRPVITLTYDYGLTAPETPGSLSPSGSIAALTAFTGTFADIKDTDTLERSEVYVYSDDVILESGGVPVYTSLYYGRNLPESESAITAGVFNHVPDGWTPKVNTTYKWRARVLDSEGEWSAWTDFVSFSVTNTAPDPPVLRPTDGSSRTTPSAVWFRGAFTDDDAPNWCAAYEVQMSEYAEGDAHWLDDEFILWATGKQLLPSGSTSWETKYTGGSVNSGTYYWRARHWDNKGTASAWAYASITFTADFEVEANEAGLEAQHSPRAPWRIVIRDMGANRGPGDVVAILEDATNVGASMLYNSPGEAHWTLGVSHPQLSVIEPKQTHYAIEMRQGDGWREVFAGLVWDFDATERDIVFYGIDYLALLDYVVDERYDPSNPDKSSDKGGSKYVNETITAIITSQLTRAKNLTNSPVGFIDVGSIDAMGEQLTLFSTFQPTLNLVAGLLDSHKAGTGKRSRLFCRKTPTGYEWVVDDDPGVDRDNLRLRYGEMVQGYRVVAFGTDWGSRVAAVGRDKEGVRVRYKSVRGEGISETTWGRFTKTAFFDGVSDANDFARKAKQQATAFSRLGKSIGLGLRSDVLKPRDGYDLCDNFPVDIEHGSVSTSAFGSGYWTAVGITWVATEKGDSTTTLTLLPVEDGTAPDTDLLTAQPVSTQAEWQVGWTAPTTVSPTSKYWLNQTTGEVYVRTAGAILASSITGTA